MSESIKITRYINIEKRWTIHLDIQCKWRADTSTATHHTSSGADVVYTDQQVAFVGKCQFHNWALSIRACIDIWQHCPGQCGKSLRSDMFQIDMRWIGAGM